MYLEHPEFMRKMGNEHLEALIAEAEAERRAIEVEKANQQPGDHKSLLNWVTHWRRPARRVAPKGI